MGATERLRLRWVYNAMVQRCVNTHRHDYPLYGGRGISVHPDWRGRGGFDRWLADLGPRPTRRHELDRIDNELGYEPGNVRWVAHEIQVANRRRSKRCLTLEQEAEVVAAVAAGQTQISQARKYTVHPITIQRICERAFDDSSVDNNQARTMARRPNRTKTPQRVIKLYGKPPILPDHRKPKPKPPPRAERLSPAKLPPEASTDHSRKPGSGGNFTNQYEHRVTCQCDKGPVLDPATGNCIRCGRRVGVI